MGTLIRQQYTVVDKRTGKRVTRKSSKWYIQFKGKDGRWKREPAYTDRVASTAKLVRREQEVAREIEGVYDHFTSSLGRPIGEHIADYVSDLQNRQNTEDYVAATGARVRAVCQLGDIETIPDITPSRVRNALAILSTGNDEVKKVSQATRNHYLRAIKMFAQWLVDDRRAAENVIIAMKGRAPTEKERDRQPVPSEYFAKLIRTTARSRISRLNLSGPERAVLYVAAGATGYRRNELGSITPESFDFTPADPRLNVGAATSKRRKEDGIPLDHDVADFFRVWVAGKPAGKPLWDITDTHTATMLQADLKAAGIPQPAGKKVIDFHSLRQNFVTDMALAGVNPKVAQQLARHSTIDLTMNTYAKVSSKDERAAVAKLPGLRGLTHALTHEPAKRANQKKQPETKNGRDTGLKPIAVGKKKLGKSGRKTKKRR